MSKANDIVKQLVERLGAIRRVDGFATDAGLNVSRGQPAVAGGADETLDVFELEDQIEKQRVDGSGASDCAAVDTDLLLPINIEGYAVVAAEQHMEVGHALVADIKRAIFSGDMTWGGLATHTRYIGRTIDRRAEGANAVTVLVQIRIGCVEDLASP